MRSVAARFVGFLFIFSSVAQAGVSLKNGNFHVNYVDLQYAGGFEPKIDRVYNSKSSYKGIFGPGWGIEYEAYLTVTADGSVIVHEYGGGAENRFMPLSFSSAELDKAVDTIASVANSVGALGSAGQVADYKKKLKQDADFRNSEWEKYRAQGKIQPRQLAEGTQLKSTRFNYQYITRVKGGYLRTYENGRSEQFNDVGQLVLVKDKTNNFIEFKYAKNGKLESLRDNMNRKMFFTFNNKGLLEKVVGESKKQATYSYNPRGELVQSQDADNNVYTYKYSDDGLFNLTEIGYADKTTRKITYMGQELAGNVKSVKERDGTSQEYSYLVDKGNQDHYTVKVETKGSDGKLVSTSSFEYFNARRANGEEWTQKLVQTVDGEKTETVYHADLGLPVSIKRSGEETKFEYDVKGHVTKKETPVEVTQLAYDAKAGKVSKVVRVSKETKKEVGWSEFEYDPQTANLIFAKNSEKRSVRLSYDRNGRVNSMLDQDKRRIDIRYNENSRPIEISEAKLGSLKVTYWDSGEVKNVESSGGRRIAVEVTTVFQNLMDIIRPAGVTLSF